MEAAKDRNLPRAIIINKIDMPEVDLEALVEQIRRRSAPNACRSICRPAAARAVVECLLNTDGESDFDTVKRCHAAMLDQIVEMDENLMEKYLGGEEPDYEALHAPFEKAMDEGHVMPICLHRCQERRRRRRIARCDRQAFPLARGRQSRAVHAPAKATDEKAVHVSRTIRTSRCWRTCSR